MMMMRQAQKDTEHVPVWKDVKTGTGCECGEFFIKTVHAETGANFYIEEFALCHNCKATINLQNGKKTRGLSPKIDIR